MDRMTQKTDKYDILIVDDARDSLELLNRILEERGYRVRPANSGRLALKSVAARLPDLILLDVKMPEMDGFEVCRRLKADEHSRNVPVIFISAYGETAGKVHGFKSGAVDFINEHDIGEQGARQQFETVALLVEHVNAGQIRRHHIRSALDTLEFALEQFGQ